ncbi:TPA: DUF4956 domain-containing protein [Candidatus Poribacteria bacterium]|nr:DUF4956 domain-containing protein [Candidatus Poribacteria bacterium]HIO09921.1 DUF4956 domain-containing protein [Candidatus Poribacteria bacterium]HIO45859.1 DUF4956 domain-containing protein [Candidatus Poribacteria bacterium]HIO78495.1 DUF4956 domain-containing protein [Candidatus Poribacteria bacterium]
MRNLPILQELSANAAEQVSVWIMIFNLFLSAVLSLVLGWVYAKYGSALSNRKQFARNFLPITMTTMFIITIIKSSLVLSLGLIGALSIIRFRTAIKEPEELSYLFLTIAIGMGIGANQAIITIVTLLTIIAIIWLRNINQNNMENGQNLYLTISSPTQDGNELNVIIKVLQKHCTDVNLKRFDENSNLLEASFLVGFENYSQLEMSKSELQGLNDSMRISFIDNS